MATLRELGPDNRFDRGRSKRLPPSTDMSTIFLLRFARLLRLSGKDGLTDEQRRLIGYATFSTYLDLIELGRQPIAGELLCNHRTPSKKV